MKKSTFHGENKNRRKDKLYTWSIEHDEHVISFLYGVVEIVISQCYDTLGAGEFSKLFGLRFLGGSFWVLKELYKIFSL